MATWLNVDNVPVAGRPPAVGKALGETSELRSRHRQAQEELAAAQQRLEQAEQADVAQAAERAREGSPLGSTPASVDKARRAVETAKRNAAAIGLALEGASADTVETITANAAEWLETLTVEEGRQREHALDLLGQFEQALGELRGSAGAAVWLRTAVETGRFDRPPATPVVGSAAPSSARLAVNGAPFLAADVLDWAAELAAPTFASVAVVEPVAADTT